MSYQIYNFILRQHIIKQIQDCPYLLYFEVFSPTEEHYLVMTSHIVNEADDEDDEIIEYYILDNDHQLFITEINYNYVDIFLDTDFIYNNNLKVFFNYNDAKIAAKHMNNLVKEYYRY